MFIIAHDKFDNKNYAYIINIGDDPGYKALCRAYKTPPNGGVFECQKIKIF